MRAVERVAEAIVRNKTRVLDLDLQGYFDNIRHDVLLSKVAKRVSDPEVLRVLKLILKATGKRGIAQGDVIAPMLSNVYLTEVDRMLERAKVVTRYGKYTRVEYARFADDVVILVDAHPRQDWLMVAVERRLREELARLHVVLNESKSRVADLAKGDAFGFLGFEFRRVRALSGKWRANYAPRLKKRTALLRRVEGALPTVSIAACRAGDRVDQSDPSRLGELLRHRSFDPVFWLRAGLGGEEGQASLDAGTEAPGVRLEEVE